MIKIIAEEYWSKEHRVDILIWILDDQSNIIKEEMAG